MVLTGDLHFRTLLDKVTGELLEEKVRIVLLDKLTPVAVAELEWVQLVAALLISNMEKQAAAASLWFAT